MSNRVRISPSNIAVSRPGKSIDSTTPGDFLLNSSIDVFLSGMMLHQVVNSLSLYSQNVPDVSYSYSLYRCDITAVYRETIPHNLGYIPACIASVPSHSGWTLDYDTQILKGIVASIDASNVYISTAYEYYKTQSTSFSKPVAGSSELPSSLSIQDVMVTVFAEKWG